MNSNSSQLAMKHGLALGGLFLVNFAISQVQSLGFLSILAYVAIIFLLYKSATIVRDRCFDGCISFGRAFGYLMLLFIYATMIAAVGHFVYYKWLNPDVIPNLIEQSLTIFDILGTYEQYEMASTMSLEEALYATITPVSLTFSYFLMDILASFLPSLIIALIVRKDAPAQGSDYTPGQIN